MNGSIVGRVVDEVVVPVERGKVRELARASLSDDPLYRDPEAATAAGFADVPAPLTWSLVAMHWRERDDDAMVEELGLDVDRVLHGEAEWEYLAPVVAGDVLRCVRRVTDVTTREGRRGGVMTIVTLESEWTDRAGRVVLRQRDRLIERSA